MFSYLWQISHEEKKEFNPHRNSISSSRHLLTDHNGNANKRNRENQTALHCLLQAGNEVRRNECLTLLLKWKEKNTNETLDLDAKDSVGLVFLSPSSVRIGNELDLPSG